MVADPESDMATQGRRDVLQMVGGRFATHAVLVISALAIPRLLGVGIYGTYAAFMAVVAILQTVSSLGLPMVEMRHIAPAYKAGQSDDLSRLGSTIWTSRILLSLVAAICAWIWIGASLSIQGTSELSMLIGAMALCSYGAEATMSLLLPLGRAGMTALLEFIRSLFPLLCVALMFHWRGLPGVFGLLACLYFILFLVAFNALRQRITLRPFHYKLSALRPHIAYSLTNFVGTLAGTLQAQFCIYAAATMVTSNEAAYLSLSVRVFLLVQGVYIAARRALMPLLAQMEHQAEIMRMRVWGGLMMRYSAAGACVIVVSWSLIGREVVNLLLTEAYAPVYRGAIATSTAAAFYCCASSCTVLMYIQGRAKAASGSIVLYAALTVVGMFVVTSGSAEDISFRIACVYAASALIFWFVAYALLAATTGLWLPLRRTLILLLPLLPAWAVPYMDWSFTMRLIILLVFLAAYPAAAVVGGLLPRTELKEIVLRKK